MIGNELRFKKEFYSRINLLFVNGVTIKCYI